MKTDYEEILLIVARILDPLALEPMRGPGPRGEELMSQEQRQLSHQHRATYAKRKAERILSSIGFEPDSATLTQLQQEANSLDSQLRQKTEALAECVAALKLAREHIFKMRKLTLLNAGVGLAASEKDAFGMVLDFDAILAKAETTALSNERIAHERTLKLVNHFHAVTCGVNDLLQMCREHFIEAPAMGEWARHCLSAQLKIKHVLDERDKLISAISKAEKTT